MPGVDTRTAAPHPRGPERREGHRDGVRLRPGPERLRLRDRHRPGADQRARARGRRAPPSCSATTGTALVGKVTYFDPTSDLAVVAVPGLGRPALPVDRDSRGRHDGGHRRVPVRRPVHLGRREGAAGRARPGCPTSTGSGTSVRSLATRRGGRRAGQLGRPAARPPAGHVLGIVFAKSSTTADIGYAMTPGAVRHGRRARGRRTAPPSRRAPAPRAEARAVIRPGRRG